jgi:hypothetical protein
MKRAGILFALLTITAALAWPQSTEKKPEAVKPIHALSWLVGGVWTADTSSMGHGMQRIETRYQWSDNASFLRFTTHFVFDKGTARTYDGNLFWNPTQNSLAMWYMNADNEIIEGPMQVNGDAWTMTFRGTDPEGKMADLRADVIRKSPDLYHWSVREKQAGTWKEIMALEYQRLSGS